LEITGSWRLSVSELRIASSNVERDHPATEVYSDASWIVNNFEPDIWGCQEAKQFIKVFKELTPSYGVALKDSTGIGDDCNNPIIYRKSRLRLLSSEALRVHMARLTPIPPAM